MKSSMTFRLLFLTLLFSAPGIFAAEKPAKKTDAYAQAVVTYIDGATQQLKAIREAVDARAENAPDTVKLQYAEVTRQLGQCDEYVRQLRLATPLEFDRLKTEFEHTRAEMVKTLDGIQQKN